MLTNEEKDRLGRSPLPEWTSPMLATLTEEYFSDKNWIFERKLDGVRCLIFCNGPQVRIMSRNRNDISSSYPELVQKMAENHDEDLVADGEIVTFENNLSSFSRLQQRMHVQSPDKGLVSRVPVFLYLFDLIHIGEYNVGKLPLRRRKQLLKGSISFEDPVRYCIHRNKDGQSLLKEACAKGWEGLIAKRADASYQHKRSKDWLKFKCTHQQELVIGGYTEPQGSRKGFGALLVGYYEEGTLRYAGKVGTGFTDELLIKLHSELDELEQPESAFSNPPRKIKDIHWVKPQLVAEIGFTEWTGTNKLRHPRYLGLRKDKNARNVVKES